MTGPEHYKEAERLLGAAEKISTYLAGLADDRGRVTTAQQKQEIDAGEQAIITTAGRAQAHATLALAAAVAIQNQPTAADRHAWADAAGDKGGAS